MSSAVVPPPTAMAPNPEVLPVIVLHHDRGVMVYCDRPCLIVEIDDGVPHDRMFVHVAGPAPVGLLAGPVSCSDRGGPDLHRRKQRFVDWLRSWIPVRAQVN